MHLPLPNMAEVLGLSAGVITYFELNDRVIR